MRHLAPLLYLILSIAAFRGNAATPEPQPQPQPRPPAPIDPKLPPPPSMNDSANIPPSLLSSYKKNALDGDADTAFRVADYYSLIVNSPSEYRYWLVIAAENGNLIAEYNLGKQLLQSTEWRSRQRGAFWLRKSRRH